MVRKAVEAATKGLNPAIEINYTLDASNWIHRSLGSLESSITTAIVLVMIVVVAALGLRSALLVALPFRHPL